MLRFDCLVFAWCQARTLDFADLEAEQVELLSISFFVDDERGFLLPQSGVPLGELGKLFALRVQAAKSVEDVQLPADVKEGLMFVRAMNIDERFANFGKQS